MTQEIIILESVDSTNRYAKEIAEQGAAHGVSVLAKVQTSGRGRLGKQWESASNKGLYGSIVLRPDVPLEWFAQLTLVVGVAIAESIENLLPAVQIGLKWPNDIFIYGRKVAGILTESSSLLATHDRRYVIVGVGINTNQEAADFPDEIQQKATSLYIESGEILEISDLFNNIRCAILLAVTNYQDNGLQQVLSKWRARDILFGKDVVMVNCKQEIVEGRAVGINDLGVLEVMAKDGAVHQILSGDVSLAK